MATVSYGMKINSENRIVDRTIGIYRDAVKYLMEIVSMHYDELAAISGTSTASVQQLKQQYIEKLVHSTKFNHAKYTEFDRRFYKFPSYLRRDAITTAIGKIMSYQSMVCNWESKGRTGKRPFLNKTQDVMPCFYRKNTFLQDQNKISLKLFNGKDWVWHRMTVRNSDFLYALKNIYDWKACAPVLQKCGHRYELRIAYEKPSSSFPRYKKDVDIEPAVAVDLGINTDAVCSVMHKSGKYDELSNIEVDKQKDADFHTDRLQEMKIPIPVLDVIELHVKPQPTLIHNIQICVSSCLSDVDVIVMSYDEGQKQEVAFGDTGNQ